MSILHKGKYRKRFQDVVDLIEGNITSVCELCFGDIFIAEFCRKNNISWMGIDLSPEFCRYAQGKGFNATLDNVLTAELPNTDMYIIQGSLYHFKDKIDKFFDRLLKKKGSIIIAEPVRNFSSSDNFIGRLARRASNAGIGHNSFRYDHKSLIDELRRQQLRSPYEYEVIHIDREMLIKITCP